MTPQRIQLRRTKGWRKPEGAIVVARPSRWGNPFKVGEWIDRDDPLFTYVTTPVHAPAFRRAVNTLSKVRVSSRAQAVELHGWWIIEQPALMLRLSELRGHDLACFCPLDQPCHADTLLELANG